MTSQTTDRRPLDTRQKPWVLNLAHRLDKLGFSPNGITICGILISLLGSAAIAISLFITAPILKALLFVMGAGAVQLRLLANMMDGMVAVECNKRTPDGDFFNETPDRLEDALFLCATGYAAGNLALGEFAAMLAISTAYLRAYRASRGLGQDFRGPGAKPHRMFTLTCTLVLTSLASFCPNAMTANTLQLGLVIICLITGITIIRRAAGCLAAMREVKS